MVHMTKECQERKHLGRIKWDAVIPDFDHLIQQQPRKRIATEDYVPKIWNSRVFRTER